MQRQLLTIMTALALPTLAEIPHASPPVGASVSGSVVGSVIMGAASASHATGDAVLLQMREAVRKNDALRLQELLPQVQGHPLEPLAAYWALKTRLEQASPDEIRAFLARYAGSYYEDRLRNDWLLLLGKRADWATFAAELPLFRMNDDREVQCYALLQTQPRPVDVAAQVAERWLAQKDIDQGCASAARELLQNGQMAPAVAWQRARLALENGRQRAATQAVELVDSASLPVLQDIYANPQRYLDDKITALRPRTKELVTLALVRLATRDEAAAAEHASRLRWRAQLTDEELGWVWGVIGKRAALNLHPQALDHFAHTDDARLSDDQLAWKTRAALRASAWSQVAAAIAAMGPAQQQEPAWTYWRARALQALYPNDAAQQAQAQTLYQRIAGSKGFYEQLALEALGQLVTLPPAPAPLSAQESASAQHNPSLQRALHAIRIGLRAEGVREWNYATNLHTPGGMNERELLAAADLACQHEVWDRCINTSERTRASIDHLQRYPTPFHDLVARRAQEVNLDPAYVYGLIRQESRFVMDARSGVGASGLMQVMPATAAWTARRIGLSDFKASDITQRDTNIRIGTAYLKFALDDVEGSMPMAAAAYNAGPGRPRNWRNGPVLEGAVWVENIPFTETRDYVKNVLANTLNYSVRLTGQPQKPSTRLGTVGPRAVQAVAVNRELP